MRNFLIALTGFLVGGAVIVAVAVATPQTTNGTPAKSPGVAAMRMSGMGTTMMGAAAAPTAAKLTIQHVQRGCHVWSNGTTTAVTMRLKLKPGQRLTVLDMDVDAHQLLQFAGPAHLRLGAPMMTNHSVV